MINGVNTNCLANIYGGACIYGFLSWNRLSFEVAPRIWGKCYTLIFDFEKPR